MTLTTAIDNLAELIKTLPGYDPYRDAGDCTFDEQAAADAIEFVETCCTHVKGELAKTPLLLEDWQKAVFANLFGWKRPDGSRRYREALVYIPRKNSKTTMAAAIVCLVLFTDGEPGAECYSSAAEREQARLCFEVVQGMIRQESAMAEHAKLFKYSVTVGGSSYKALSAEAGSKHGFNAHLIVNDELHAHPTPELTEVLMTSTGSRRQPLCVHLTTADYEREGSICNSKHDYAHQVLDGTIRDASFLPVVYEASKDDDWTDPKIWEKANPNLGVSVSREYIEHECQRAKDSPTFENTFKRLHLNIRTEQDVRWLQLSAWDACKVVKPIDPLIARQKCWCGLDLSSTTDLTAFAAVFPEGEKLLVKLKIWVPGESVHRRAKNDRVPYDQWIREGWLTSIPGPVIRYEWIRKYINEFGGEHNIVEIAADEWNATQLLAELADDDFEIVKHRQGFVSMSNPSKQTEASILAKRIVHEGNPVLRWAIGNVVAEMDAAGNVKPTKKKSTEKIDPLVALIMGIGRAVLQEGPDGCFYEDHEVRVI